MQDERNADLPIGADGRAYHLGMCPGDIPPYVLLVGDPERARHIAATELNTTTLRGSARYPAYVGFRNGVKIAVVAHGIGGTSLVTLLYDLFLCGGRRFIRIGSSSALIERANIGDVLVWDGAYNCDGVSTLFGVGDGQIVLATRTVSGMLRDVAEEREVPCHFGVGVTTNDFMYGQARPGLIGTVSSHIEARHQRHLEQGVIGYEMELSALFACCQAHEGLDPLNTGTPWRLEYGGVTAVFANRRKPNAPLREGAGVQHAIRIAVQAMMELHWAEPMEGALTK
ncbi:MAG: hypothetical protein KC925_03975 [Candidatus Doudnabacteria bacterium]|nr:hypothetical protein [Candidatus Doudnabacteria bacterium]